VLRRVVGYQNKTVADSAAGGNTWLVATLPSVGVDESELKLDSWKVVAPDGGLQSMYSVQVATFGADGQISGGYVYLDENTCSEYSCDPGWYETESVEGYDPIPAGSVKIPYGEGVQIASSDCGATVTFAGQVAGARTFTINDSDVGGNTWTGNTSPVDLKLKDLAITAPDGGLQSMYSVQVATFGVDGQISGDYVYLDENTCGEYSCDPGWYTTESVEGYDPISAGEVDVASAQMFQIASSDCGGQITIPDPMN